MTEPRRKFHRSTTDIVIIIFAAMVGIMLVIGMVGLLVLKFYRPELNVQAGTEAIVNIITTIVGALVGFIGGRAYGRSEANGNGK